MRNLPLSEPADLEMEGYYSPGMAAELAAERDHGNGSGISEYRTGDGKWGALGAFGTGGGTITFSIADAGVTAPSDFYSGASVQFDSIVSFGYETLIRDAFATWSSVANIDFVEVSDNGGPLTSSSSSDIRIVAGYIDGSPAGGSVLARAYLPVAGGTAAQGNLSGDIVIDSGETWNSSLFYTTVLHEIGHSLGLQHSEDRSSIMYAFSNPNVVGLSADDIAGIQAIYGARNASGTDDFAGDSSTLGRIIPGGSRAGEIETTGDSDWFAFAAVAGTQYRFDLSARAGAGAIDPVLQLVNSGGAVLGLDDNSGPGSDATFVFTSTVDQQLYLVAEGVNGTLGGYTVASTILNVSDDYTADPTRAGQLAVGSTGTGRIEQAGDMDWFAISLAAGTSYAFELRGQDGNGGTLLDPTLTLRDPAQNVVRFNDDGGTGLGSRIVYTPLEDGTYYLAAAAFADGTGSYSVSVAPAGTSGPDDYGEDMFTAGSLGHAADVAGALEMSGDRDWLAVVLMQGVSYSITMDGIASPSGTALDDPFLALRNGDGSVVAVNDDRVPGDLNSTIRYTPSRTDTYFVEAGAYEDLGTGSYVVRVTPQMQRLDGTEVADLLQVSDTSAYLIDARGGSDQVLGGAGDDHLLGGSGADYLNGRGGRDYLEGGSGNDVYVVGAGDVVYEAGVGDFDVIQFEVANRALANDVEQGVLLEIAGAGVLEGNEAANLLSGNGSANTILVGGGSNLAYGQGGNDTLIGGTLADLLNGQDGTDNIEGGAGSDILLGEWGDDTLWGGSGYDFIAGGFGDDTFRIDAPGAVADRIADYGAGSDRIQLQGSAYVALGAAVEAYEFAYGSAALYEAQRLLYDTSTGRLLYDADGSGFGAAVHIATIDLYAGNVEFDDFVII